MFEKGLKFRFVNNIHSFCYVAGDPNITGLFTPEEREELEAEPKSIQPFIANGTFHKFYNKFASCETANDLRKLLYGTSHEELLSDGPLQGESWHCQMYHAFLTDILLQDGRIDCFREDLSEAWLLANPYHVLQLMFNDKKNVFFCPARNAALPSVPNGSSIGSPRAQNLYCE